MHTLKVTLKQHTPLIHFQHDQEGATLRASEVKPKLDKFILTKLGNGDYQQGFEIAKQKGWIINGGKNDCKALDYKMRITASGNEFSNHSIVSENNIGIKNTDIVCTILIKNERLKNIIDSQIKDFFIIHNFGKRQSKGYGSFYILGTTVNDIKNVLKTHSQDCLFSKTFTGGSFENEINKAWSKLKSGQNTPYQKSRIFKYSSSKKITWEKRFLKIELIDLIDNDPSLPDLLYTHEPLDCSKDEDRETYNGWENNQDLFITHKNDYGYYFMRALLGLPELYEFRSNIGNKIFQIKIKGVNVERFKSPVTFKVYQNHIYSFLDSDCQKILNQRFYFEFYLKEGRDKRVLKEEEVSLSTPKNFDIRNFLLSYMPTVEFNRI